MKSDCVTACRYLGTIPGMKPGQVMGHEVRHMQNPTMHAQPVTSTHMICLTWFLVVVKVICTLASSQWHVKDFMYYA